MGTKDLVRFVKEARKRGFDDWEIRNPLLKQGWPSGEIELAFNLVDKKQYSGNKVKLVIKIDRKIYNIIDKRAKKNLLSAEEQIEDIIRRSSVNSRMRKMEGEKIDDLLVGIFSRKMRGKKKK